jgi:hypothetical protein
LVGTARYHLLYRTAEGEFGTAEFRLPLRYALSGEEGCAEGADTMLTVRATLLSDRIRVEGASLSLDAEWGIDARLCVRGAIEAVDLLRMGAPYAERGDALRHLAPSLVQLFVEVCARRAEYGLLDIVLVHLGGEELGVEVHIEGASEETDMGMGVYLAEAGKVFTNGVFHGVLL